MYSTLGARKCRVAVWVGVIVAMAISGPVACADFQRGDSNLDGTMNLTDAIYTLQYLASGGPTPGCLDGADVDDNGSVNIVDAVHFLHFLFVGFSPPAPPYPNCGPDSTADALDCQLHPFCP